jgi:hypothetical protein
MNDEPLIVSTEPAPVPADERCPRCRDVDHRVPSGGFGRPSTLCGKCGYDFRTPWEG